MSESIDSRRRKAAYLSNCCLCTTDEGRAFQEKMWIEACEYEASALESDLSRLRDALKEAVEYLELIKDKANECSCMDAPCLASEALAKIRKRGLGRL